MKRFQS